MISEKEKTYLKGDNAFALWAQGKDAWNKWVEQNPIADIDFVGVIFSEFHGEKAKVHKELFPSYQPSKTNFSEFKFPTGRVNFSDAIFSDEGVSFNKAEFGDGDVDFFNSSFGSNEVNFAQATFGKGNVSFAYAKFGKGDVSFLDVNFGEGNVNFTSSKFGDGDVNFRQASFGSGEVSFLSAIFGTGKVSFQDAKFGDVSVSFVATIFGDGDVDFFRATFGNGLVSFYKATFGTGEIKFKGANFGDLQLNFEFTNFGDGDMDFYEASFGNKGVYFSNAIFGIGKIQFLNAKFTGKFYLEDCKNTDKIQSLTFKNAMFKDAVLIKNITLKCVLDLVNTCFTNQTSLYGLTCSLNRKKNKLGVMVVCDEDDIERLIRLKELAESNKNHEQALAFHASEQRAKRWVNTGKLASMMDMIFSASCNYGQSILRPFMILVFSILIFTVPYTLQSDSFEFSNSINSEMLVFSAANSTPFLTSARNARENGFMKIFEGQEELSWIYATMMLQGFVSVMLLFLIGLGLRNRFRI